MADQQWSFDKEAISWDKNPGRVKLAQDIADAILGEDILSREMEALEFGCGTGLLTVLLSRHVRSVTGVDSSRGMLEVLKDKIEREGLPNIQAQYVDIDNGDALEGVFDLVVCSMTLHHVKEIKPLLDLFHKVTAPEGYLCLADLDPDDGQFHGDNDTVFHDGFDRAVLKQALLEAGFESIRVRTAANVVKPILDRGTRSFSIFLMIGRKKG